MKACVHIIDDDASFRTAIERLLTQAGYEVATYPSALHLLVSLPNECTRSCILLDVRLPGMDGPALQKRLIELGSTLPIISSLAIWISPGRYGPLRRVQLTF